MVQIRNMQENEAEHVRDLWLQMCMEAGTPLPGASSQLILTNLMQYSTHQLVHCFVAEEQHTLIGFITCAVTGHPVMPGLRGDIEELYVQPDPNWQQVRAALVGHAVAFMLAQGARSIHTSICVGKECPGEAQLRAFWQSLGWENDMTTYSIYSDVPGNLVLQHVWNGYQEQTQTVNHEQQS